MTPVADRQDVGLCRRCSRVLKRSAFYLQSVQDKRWSPPRIRQRYSPYCKECMIALLRAYEATERGQALKRARRVRRREENREALRAYNREYKRRRRREAGILPTKGTRGCRVCGERKPHADFPAPTGRICGACKARRPRLSPQERYARHSATCKRWRDAHKEWRHAKNQAYWAAHRERILAQQRARRAARKAAAS